MKNKLLAICCVFSMFVFSGCENTVTTTNLDEKYFGSRISVMVIDSCEYVFINSDTRSLTHKGNCKFCAERNKK